MARKKIVASTENNSWVAPKVRKKRKPMTEEQRIAAAERLESARAARAPAKNDSVCSYVTDKLLETLKSGGYIKTKLDKNGELELIKLEDLN